MANKKIGVGIIGVTPYRSWAALAHIPALQALPDFEIRALSTTRQESADAAAQCYGIPRAFDNAEALVTCPEVDLVVVAVKVPHHKELVTLALQHGKSVYCEWPLGNGLAEAEAMTALAQSKGVHAVVGLQARSSPVINRVRDLIAEGYVGKVLSTSMIASGVNWGAVIDSRDGYTQQVENGATLLTIPFGHTVDALCHCLGEFSELSATIATRRDSYTLLRDDLYLPMTAHEQLALVGEGTRQQAATSPDQIAVNGVLANGAVAALHFRGGSSRGTNLLWEINGTEGDLQITSFGGMAQMFDLSLSGARADEAALQPLDIPDRYYWLDRNAVPGHAFNIAQTYVHLARDMREGSHTCPGFVDALSRHRMLADVVKAAESGQRQSR